VPENVGSTDRSLTLGYVRVIETPKTEDGDSHDDENDWKQLGSNDVTGWCRL